MSVFVALPFVIILGVILLVVSYRYFKSTRTVRHMPVRRVAVHPIDPRTFATNGRVPPPPPPPPLSPLPPPPPLQRRSSANVSRRTSADYDMSAWLPSMTSTYAFSRLPGDTRRSSNAEFAPPNYRYSGVY